MLGTCVNHWTRQNIQIEAETREKSTRRRFLMAKSNADRMFSELMPKIHAIIDRELPTSELLSLIKSDPSNKREYWMKLKFIAFCRAFGCVLSGAILFPLSQIMIVNIVGNTKEAIVDSVEKADENDDILTIQVHGEYLKMMDRVIEEELPKMLSKMTKLISDFTRPLPLDCKFTLNQFENLLNDISSIILDDGKREESRVSTIDLVLPFSRYIPEPDLGLFPPNEASKLENLHFFTLDLMDTKEFGKVVLSLVKIGVGYILDEISPLYFECSSQTESENEDKSVKISEITEKSVHIVKIIPVLSNVVKTAFPLEKVGPNDPCVEYFNKIRVDPSLENFTSRIYDSLLLGS